MKSLIDKYNLYLIGIPDDYDEATVIDLFENERQTGGGKVTDIHICDSHDTMVVTFKDPSGITKICIKEI